MNVEAEIESLKRRVGDLEGALNVLTGQMQNVRPELARLASESANRFDTIDAAVEALGDRVNRIDIQLWSLRDDLPILITEAVRKALED